MTDTERRDREAKSRLDASLELNDPTPPSAGVLPLDSELPPEAEDQTLAVDPVIAAKLKSTNEQRQVVGPLVQLLVNVGWQLDQLVFGRREWRVPKTPAEATKRERGHSFEGFPCDVAIFDSPDRRGDPRHLLAIIEAKTPDEEAGVSQLETYMGLEPYTKLGLWANSPDPSSPAVFVYRKEGGGFVERHRLLEDVPQPGEPISEEQRRLTFRDLTVPSARAIKQTIELTSASLSISVGSKGENGADRARRLPVGSIR